MNSEESSIAHDGRNLGPGVQIRTYRIESPVGAGGMGIVYRALDTKLNRIVAIKFLSAAEDFSRKHERPPP